jgi:hypothetical protein
MFSKDMGSRERETQNSDEGTIKKINDTLKTFLEEVLLYGWTFYNSSFCV